MMLVTVGVRDSSASDDEVAEVDRLLVLTMMATVGQCGRDVVRLQQRAVLGRFGARERRRWAVPS